MKEDKYTVIVSMVGLAIGILSGFCLMSYSIYYLPIATMLGGFIGLAIGVIINLCVSYSLSNTKGGKE